MDKSSELLTILNKSEFKQEAEQFTDFLEYFADSTFMQTQEPKNLINQMLEALQQSSKTTASYFNYYVSSYFKDPQKNSNVKQTLFNNLSQLCRIIANDPTKSLQLEEYLSLHLPLKQTLPNFHHNNLDTTPFYQNTEIKLLISYFKMNNTGNNGINNNEPSDNQEVRIPWSEFKIGFEAYISDQNKHVQMDFSEMIACLKNTIDTKSDNFIDYQEITEFFRQYATLDDMTKKAESNRPSRPNQLQPPWIEFVKIPSDYRQHYEERGFSRVQSLQPFQNRYVFGRKSQQQQAIQQNDTNGLLFLQQSALQSSLLQSIPAQQQMLFSNFDTRISRQHLAVTRDEAENYFVELLSQQPIYFKVNQIPLIVRQGYQIKLTKKSTQTLYIDKIIPESQPFLMSKMSNQGHRNSTLHPKLDYPFIQLHSTIHPESKIVDSMSVSQNSSNENSPQSDPSISIFYNDKIFTFYASKTPKFTIGNNYQTDLIVVQQSELNQVTFQYIPGYTWVIYETKPSSGYGSLIRDSLGQPGGGASKVGAQFTNPAEQRKYLIYEGMTLCFLDYEAQFSFKTKQ